MSESRKRFIVGNGDYAKMLNRYLKNTTTCEVVCFSVPRDFISEDMIDGVPVIPSEEISEVIQPKDAYAIMGIGYRNMNQIKAQEFERYKELGYLFANYIHPTAIIEKNVVLGEGNNIFEGVIIQEGVRIGDANLIYGGALIAHETTMGSYNSISVKACVAGCVDIGKNCFIGANATIRDHIKLANYTLAGAGVYIDKSTKAFDVVVSPRAEVLEGKKSLEFI